MIARDDIWNRSKIQWCGSFYLSGPPDYIWLAEPIIFVLPSRSEPSWSYLFSGADDICSTGLMIFVQPKWWYLLSRDDDIWPSWLKIKSKLICHRLQLWYICCDTSDTSDTYDVIHLLPSNPSDGQQTGLGRQWIGDWQLEMADKPWQCNQANMMSASTVPEQLYFFGMSLNSLVATTIPPLCNNNIYNGHIPRFKTHHAMLTISSRWLCSCSPCCCSPWWTPPVMPPPFPFSGSKISYIANDGDEDYVSTPWWAWTVLH